MRTFVMIAWGIGAACFIVASFLSRRAQRKFEKAEQGFLRATAIYEQLAANYERERAYQEHVRQTAERQ